MARWPNSGVELTLCRMALPISSTRARPVVGASCIITTVGAGDTMDQAPWTFKLLMQTMMQKVIDDKNAQEALFLDGPGADLEFCIARPGGLKLGPPSGIVNVIDGEAGAINRADLATFCLDAVLEPDFVPPASSLHLE